MAAWHNPTEPEGMSYTMQPTEDWEDWLRWDPAAELTSLEDPHITSGLSSQNDSPLQNPAYVADGHLFDKATADSLAAPLIVGDESLDFTSVMDFANPDSGINNSNNDLAAFSFGAEPRCSPSFDFQTALDGQPFPSDLSRLDVNTTAWPVDSDPATSAPSSAYSHKAESAASYSGSSPSSKQSPQPSEQSRRESYPLSDAPKKRGGRKRKADATDESGAAALEEGESPEDDEPPVKKTSHNVIEKRYRNNLNDKIVELRNSVPSLRAMGRANKGKDSEDLEGLTPAHKLNKATVMAKATEYIRHLEKRNKNMADEMSTLKARLAAVEAAIGKSSERNETAGDSASMNTHRSRQASTASQIGTSSAFLQPPSDQPRFSVSVNNAPPRMIQRFVPQQSSRSTSSGYHHQANPPPAEARQRAQAPLVNGRGGGRGGVMNKVMLGTMAAIMVMESFSEPGQADDDASARQLFSIPVTLVKNVRRFVPDLSNPTAPLSPSGVPLMAVLKIMLAITALLYLVAPLLTFSPPPRRQKMRTVVQLPQASSLASPVEERRKAWLTALQSVWVPKHFLLEVVAVCSKMIQLSVRRIIGSEAFTEITGTTKEEEAARIKAWDIAIDAQLAGGDAEVSYYRLLLTLMESGTLPDSPARLMQKAVHFRVFFWEVANAGYGNMIGFRQFTENVGRFYWDSARKLQKDVLQARSQGRPDVSDEAIELLPDHLARLVELPCDEVLSDEIIQRAWNLAWNKSSAHCLMENPARDSVVEDHAIRSPLDAVAAWYTNALVDEILAEALAETPSSSDTEFYIRQALSVAPPASNTHVRALVAKAVLSNSGREANILAALDALPVVSPLDASPSGGMNLVRHAPASPEIPTALTLAKLISLCAPSAPKRARAHAHVTLRCLELAPAHFTLLTVVASVRLLRFLAGAGGDVLPADTTRSVENLASDLRVWIGTSAGRDSGLDHASRARVVGLCVGVTKRLGGWDERDSGYGSIEAPTTAKAIMGAVAS